MRKDPSEHQTLAQCWLNAGHAGPAFNQYSGNVSCSFWDDCRSRAKCRKTLDLKRDFSIRHCIQKSHFTFEMDSTNSNAMNEFAQQRNWMDTNFQRSPWLMKLRPTRKVISATRKFNSVTRKLTSATSPLRFYNAECHLCGGSCDLSIPPAGSSDIFVLDQQTVPQ